MILPVFASALMSRSGFSAGAVTFEATAALEPDAVMAVAKATESADANRCRRMCNCPPGSGRKASRLASAVYVGGCTTPSRSQIHREVPLNRASGQLAVDARPGHVVPGF